jgi:hypothetical protein
MAWISGREAMRKHFENRRYEKTEPFRPKPPEPTPPPEPVKAKKKPRSKKAKPEEAAVPVS